MIKFSASKSIKQTGMAFTDFNLNWVSSPRLNVSMTQEEFQALGKKERTAIKNQVSGVWFFGKFINDSRSKGVEYKTAIMLDYDDEVIELIDLVNSLDTLGYDYFIWDSINSTPGHRRLKVVMPFLRPTCPRVAEMASRAIADELGYPTDKTTHEQKRVTYSPVVFKNNDYYFSKVVNKGTRLIPEDLDLAEYESKEVRSNILEMPLNLNQGKRKEKESPIENFNRQSFLPQVLERDFYEIYDLTNETEKAWFFTFKKGTGESGIIIYKDNPQYASIYHESDPMYSHVTRTGRKFSAQAFDFYQVHKYQGMSVKEICVEMGLTKPKFSFDEIKLFDLIEAIKNRQSGFDLYTLATEYLNKFPDDDFLDKLENWLVDKGHEKYIGKGSGNRQTNLSFFTLEKTQRRINSGKSKLVGIKNVEKMEVVESPSNEHDVEIAKINAQKEIELAKIEAQKEIELAKIKFKGENEKQFFEFLGEIKDVVEVVDVDEKEKVVEVSEFKKQPSNVKEMNPRPCTARDDLKAFCRREGVCLHEVAKRFGLKRDSSDKEFENAFNTLYNEFLEKKFMSEISDEELEMRVEYVLKLLSKTEKFKERFNPLVRHMIIDRVKEGHEPEVFEKVIRNSMEVFSENDLNVENIFLNKWSELKNGEVA